MLLTKHEDKTFTGQTLYISGQAFLRCRFVDCTLVLRETAYHLDGCHFERCNWMIEWMLLWGCPESLKEIKGLIQHIEASQASLPRGPEAPEQTVGEGLNAATRLPAPGHKPKLVSPR